MEHEHHEHHHHQIYIDEAAFGFWGRRAAVVS
jgi:hypothetical protein